MVETAPFQVEKFTYLGIVITKKFEAPFDANFTTLIDKLSRLLENITNLRIKPCKQCQNGLPSSTSLSPAEHTNFDHQNLLHLHKAELKGGLHGILLGGQHVFHVLLAG